MRICECVMFFNECKQFVRRLEDWTPEYRYRRFGRVVGHNTFKIAGPNVSLNNSDSGILVCNCDVSSCGINGVVARVLTPLTMFQLWLFQCTGNRYLPVPTKLWKVKWFD
jgi:hypothetical protein